MNDSIGTGRCIGVGQFIWSNLTDDFIGKLFSNINSDFSFIDTVAQLNYCRVNKIEDHRGWSPLHQAAKYNKIELVKYLIEKGWDINHLTHYKSTPLHFACQLGHVEVIKLLTQHGAKTGLKDQNGYTAEYLAFMTGKDEVMEALNYDKNWVKFFSKMKFHLVI